MRPTALFLTALVLGGLVSYLLPGGPEPTATSVVVSAAVLTLLWLLCRSLFSSRDTTTASPPPRGVPIPPSKEPTLTATAIAVDRDRLIARLDGEPITLGDIAEDLIVPADLSETRLWVLIERATEDLVDNKLLEREAGRRSLSVDGLLLTVEAEAPPATNEDIEAYLADLPAAVGEPTSHERVAHCISLKRRVELRVQFRFALRQRARFEFLLSPRP